MASGDSSTSWTTDLKLCGHCSIGPSGVVDQSWWRTSAASSEEPVGHAARCGDAAFT